ncbi:hypothetical protein AX16_010516 [Volvariella volvacea WC 439]|nr:hypothetical protein AX16_010516 [Volvariella volvacea WC 439]
MGVHNPYQGLPRFQRIGYDAELGTYTLKDDRGNIYDYRPGNPPYLSRREVHHAEPFRHQGQTNTLENGKSYAHSLSIVRLFTVKTLHSNQAPEILSIIQDNIDLSPPPTFRQFLPPESITDPPPKVTRREKWQRRMTISYSSRPGTLRNDDNGEKVAKSRMESENEKEKVRPISLPPSRPSPGTREPENSPAGSNATPPPTASAGSKSKHRRTQTTSSFQSITSSFRRPIDAVRGLRHARSSYEPGNTRDEQEMSLLGGHEWTHFGTEDEDDIAEVDGIDDQG